MDKSLYLCGILITKLMNNSRKLVDTVVEAIQEKKGHGITIADLRDIDGSICNYFVICQGNSPSQINAIAESVYIMAKKKLNEIPVHEAGLQNLQWVAIDYSDVVVHIFLPEVRSFYDLDNLWEDASLEQIKDLD